jgi:hypothetical protein
MEGLATYAEHWDSREEGSRPMILSAIFLVLAVVIVAAHFYLLFAIKKSVVQLVDLERAKQKVNLSAQT